MNWKVLYGNIQSKIYKVYRSNDFLPVWNFFQILKTNDCRYLLKRKDYEYLPKIYFKFNWTNIYNEFLKKTDNQEWTVQMFISEHIERLRNEYFVITRMCIYLLNHDRCTKTKEYEKYILDNGYKINYERYEESILSIIKSAKGIEKKIELKKEELKRPESEMTIDDMIGLMDKQLGYHLPLKSISVNEFIGIKNALEKKPKKNGR
jgi:hypothetical protein